MTAVIEERMSFPISLSLSLAPSHLFLRVPIDINYRCSAQRSDPHLQQMERISDISERNRLRSGAIISSRLTSLCVFILPRGESPRGTERKSFLTSRMEERLFLRFSLFILLVLLFFSLFLFLRLSLPLSSFLYASLRRSLASSHVWPVPSIILSARRFQFALFLRHYRAPRSAQNCI